MASDREGDEIRLHGARDTETGSSMCISCTTGQVRTLLTASLQGFQEFGAGIWSSGRSVVRDTNLKPRLECRNVGRVGEETCCAREERIESHYGDEPFPHKAIELIGPVTWHCTVVLKYVL